MKTLALANGDLVVTPFGHETVSGALKIKQELLAAFAESLGNDRFHPDWGSMIPSYVGQAIGPDTELLVLSEANRVIQNYIAIQQREVLQDHLDVRRSRFNTSDVVRQVIGIRATLDLDKITVFVSLVTETGESVTLTSEVGM